MGAVRIGLGLTELNTAAVIRTQLGWRHSHSSLPWKLLAWPRIMGYRETPGCQLGGRSSDAMSVVPSRQDPALHSEDGACLHGSILRSFVWMLVKQRQCE